MKKIILGLRPAARCILVLIMLVCYSFAHAQQLNIPAHFSYVKGGSFERTLYGDRDQPVGVETTLVTDFVISKFEVSAQQYKAFCLANDREWPMSGEQAELSDPKGPVNSVSYDDAESYIRWLTEAYGITFRLPSEAEWEFAARGGNQSKGYIYSGSDDVDNVARYEGNSKGKPTCISCMQPNELGIYAMSGNVWEWVANPRGNEFAVIRGGSYADSLNHVRIEGRFSLSPGLQLSDVGFRIAADAKEYNQYLMAGKINLLLKKTFNDSLPIRVGAKGFYSGTQFISWDDFDSFFIDYDSGTAGVYGGIDENHKRITIAFNYTKEQLEGLLEVQDLIMVKYAGN